ncbi:riboflavin synthase [Sporolactobacillus sp. CPB3-1]|uniref:Riboflavin synthase n=1 Tax=Sporolactobacillus mangiferae TaxID=2940498 RepID=A0ABT0MAW7_9BACL|nr:riboflavin synthase [Sporolactobacillus mangiferae]MCL1632000.1 riboflavin synthase [Sporolactobacillus mangiferae]
MFTGLIEEVGSVATIVKQVQAVRMAIHADRILSDVRPGDSIAVNGACVTVTGYSSNQFTVDLMPETIRSTTLADMRRGDPVNLERAMRVNGRYGGHFVTGHVDGVGRIVRITVKGNARMLSIQVPPGLLERMVEKGSVAVDGTSLTLVAVGSDTFTVSLIPHSSVHTLLGAKRIGDQVNIECDILQKYMQKQLERDQEAEPNKETLTIEKLHAYGFI